MDIDYDRLARVVCVANGKGGVTKTSLSANLAGLAAAAGYHTLLVDLDPQGDLSDDLGYFDDNTDDHGEQLAAALVTGSALRPTLTDVRPNLDVITGGEHLSDVTGALVSRLSRGASTTDLLARSLAPLAGQYDLVVVDTPPIDVTLQVIALGAARWLLIPTKADASSIRAIGRIAERVVDARSDVHQLDLLGVVLTGVPTAATRVRADAAADIAATVGTVAPLFDATIRASDAVARETRAKGLLVHELAEKVEGAQPFWKSLRDGTAPQRLPGSAPALAADYVAVTEQVLQRLDHLETQSRGVA
ncbi:ParA family protein [Solicola sp. PLA-1-18]|uniref:ParA family protein n=1 Tax=Solicola sp. PLA-1-18 TaxID=3380532 RepID=UPI003B7EF526